MQAILDVIERRRNAFAQHPFIRFLRDDAIPAADRLAYAPYGTHFVLTFGEFNRDFLHEDAPDSPQQEMINRHAEEDQTHFAWFLHDLKILGFDAQYSFTDVLRFLWSDEGKHARELGHYVVAAARGASPAMRLVLIEALEAQGNVWLSATAHAAQQHPEREQLIYFSQHHLDRETGHTIGSEEDAVRQTVLPDALRPAAERAVHGIYDRTEAFCAEMLRRTLRANETGASFLAD
ncbi:MAG: hypothetical protein KUG77_20960 [Nannocystaceae bacterium]|nr:hypothetical protein [Nannocystaceae bacterium]